MSSSSSSLSSLSLWASLSLSLLSLLLASPPSRLLFAATVFVVALIINNNQRSNAVSHVLPACLSFCLSVGLSVISDHHHPHRSLSLSLALSAGVATSCTQRHPTSDVGSDHYTSYMTHHHHTTGRRRRRWRRRRRAVVISTQPHRYHPSTQKPFSFCHLSLAFPSLPSPSLSNGAARRLRAVLAILPVSQSPSLPVYCLRGGHPFSG